MATVYAEDSHVVVAVGETVLHRADWGPEAEYVAAWVRFQLKQGATLDEILHMMALKGEAAQVGTMKSDAAASAPKKKKKKAAEPEPEPEVDLTVLDSTIGRLRRVIGTGEHDAVLAQLLAAEAEGRNRKGAIAAIESRIAEIG